MNEKELTIKKILVAINNSGDLTPFGAAIALAEQLQANIEAMIIEDINLVNLAGLPFARELDPISGELRQVNASNMEQSLRARSQRIKGAVTSLSHGKKVQWSMSVVRGSCVNSVMTAPNVDVLFMSPQKSLALIQSNPRTGKTARDRSLKSPILVFYDGSSAAERALSLGKKLAEILDVELVLLLSDSAQSLSKKFQQLTKTDNRIRIEYSDSDKDSIKSILKHTACSIVVIPRKLTDTLENLNSLTELITQPLVLVS